MNVPGPRFKPSCWEDKTTLRSLDFNPCGDVSVGIKIRWLVIVHCQGLRIKWKMGYRESLGGGDIRKLSQ